VPILRSIDYDTVRGIAEVIGRQLLKDHADALTMDWAVVKRTGRVFFDHNMNARSKSLASIYSPRVAPEASISFPLHWDNLEEHYPTDFTMERVPQMLAEQGDLWKDILENKNDLEKLLGTTVAGIQGASAANAPESKEGPVRKRSSRKPTVKKETGTKPRPRQKH
jgi:DNA primase